MSPQDRRHLWARHFFGHLPLGHALACVEAVLRARAAHHVAHDPGDPVRAALLRLYA